MPQSTYVIVALMILMLYVYHQRRSTIQAQETMVESAVDLIGNGIAVERLSRIRSLSFDQATRDGYINSASQLTPATNFGPSRDVNNDDVDDYAGVVEDVYRVVGGDSLGFRVASSVDYADESDPSQTVTGPTKYKRVSVQVYSIDLPDADTVQIAQTVSCKNACNW